MQTDLSIYNSLRPSFIEGVHAVKFNALSAVISRYRDYARSSEQIKAYSGDSLLMRDIASLLDEAPRPITGEYQDFTPFLLLLMLSEEFHAVHYVERLVTWYFGYCCVDELRTVCTILSQCSYPHHDTLRLRFKNYLREARKTLGMPVECNAAVMLKMLDASYEHLTPADVGEFEELLHLDSLYFLRGQTDTEQYLETFYYELDPQFSTNADFKVAKILANDMLSVYLMGELESLESTNLRNMVLPLPDVRPTWQDSKTDLTELIYLLDNKGCFGNVPLTQLASYISNAFNVHLDMNLSRTFCDMKIRNNPTPWLDKAKEALLKRMQTWKRNKKNGNSE